MLRVRRSTAFTAILELAPPNLSLTAKVVSTGLTVAAVELDPSLPDDVLTNYKAELTSPAAYGDTTVRWLDGLEVVGSELLRVAPPDVFPFLDGERLVLARGDSYLDAYGRSLIFMSEDWPDQAGRSVSLSLQLRETYSFAGSVTDENEVRVELTEAQTQTVIPGEGKWRVHSALSGDSVTLAGGHLRVVS